MNLKIHKSKKQGTTKPMKVKKKKIKKKKKKKQKKVLLFIKSKHEV